MKTIGYYPGCSLKGSSREYDESLHAIARVLDLDLVEIPDWNCCGASAAHNLNHKLSLALPARILAMAEQAGHKEILVPCAACYNRLSVARHELLNDSDLRNEISNQIDMEYKGSTKIINVLELLLSMLQNVKERIQKPFNYTVACYYGCLLVRPHSIVKFDRAEDPESMDTIIKEIGAVSIDWPSKVECCGAGFSVSRSDIVAKLSNKIVGSAVKRGADAIIVACPMCHSNLDMRRNSIEKYAKKSYSIPVMYITQAVGMALGVSAKELGFSRHIVPVKLSGNPQVATQLKESNEVEKCHA